MKTRLTKDEQDLLDSFERGKRVPVKNLSKRRAELMKYARNTLKKDKRLSVRISEGDLTELQRKAVRDRLTRHTSPASFISS